MLVDSGWEVKIEWEVAFQLKCKAIWLGFGKILSKVYKDWLEI